MLPPGRAIHARESLVMESPAKLGVDFARVVEMKSSKGQTVVQQNAAIRHVQRSKRNGIHLRKILADGNIECGVLRQIVSRIGCAGRRCAIGEAGAVIHIGRDVRLPGKSCIEAKIQRVSLVVVHRRVGVSGLAIGGRNWRTNQTARKRSACLSDLI